MFDLGGGELLVLGVVALIVVGPKDLPGLFRTVGRYTGKAKAMAREFSSAMNAAADDAGMRDIDRTIRAAANPAKAATKAATDAFKGSAVSALKPGGETEKLSQERQEQAKKIRESTAKAATKRKEREAAEEDTGAAKAAATKKPAAKTTGGKTPAAKKPAAKKADTKTSAATPPAAKKPAAKKAPAKKPATKKPAAKKPATKDDA